MERLLLYGTTAADGTLAVTKRIARPMRLVGVEWLAGDFDNGVDATLKSLGAQVSDALTIADRTLLTITDGNDDAWYTISESGNGIVEQEIRLNVTGGGNGKVGGCRLYFDTVASNAVTGSFTPAAGAATEAKQDTQITGVGSLTETAPATDTASSGLNGRLQRIAQRLTSLIALIPAALTAGGNFKVAVQEIVAPTTFYMGQKAVTTAGTELVLASSQVLISGVTLKALHANTGWIYVGTNPVTLSTGYVLDAGETVFIEVDNLADVFIDSSVNGEGVSYIGS